MRFSFYITLLAFCTCMVSVCLGQSTYQEAAVNEHNRLRKPHNSQSMIIDPKLNADAEACALDYADRGIVDHKCAKKLKKGENIYMSGQNETPDAAIKIAMEMWYRENKDYNYEDPAQSKNKVTGHFTQMVWNKSVKLGCGVKSTKGRTAAVCLYDPRGNMGNGNQGADSYQYYKENVKRPQ